MRNPRFSIPANTAATLGSGNRGDTFRPFESGAYYNDATPTLSTPPAHKNCSTLGVLIVVTVAFAATVATKGALGSKAWLTATVAGSVVSQAVATASLNAKGSDTKSSGFAHA